MSMNMTIIEQVRRAVDPDTFWPTYLDARATAQPPPISVHLAVLVEPYLQYVLDGTKTVESRFSVRQTAPYGRVKEGDVLLLKKVSGPIVGLCRVAAVWHYHLDPESLAELRSEFAAALCAQDPEFWNERSSASFATLMRLQNVCPITPIHIEKRDRRGWVILRRRSQQLLLWGRMKQTVIGFSGRIKSGKTTVSQAVADALSCQRASFGDFVRAEATRQGLDAESRSVLQDVGEMLIVQGWPQFCRNVLATADWQPGSSVVVDGIRHAEAVRQLARIVDPIPFVLVHVAVDEEVQQHRIQDEESQNLEDTEFHSTEADVKEVLPMMADLVIDGSHSVDDLGSGNCSRDRRTLTMNPASIVTRGEDLA